MATSQKARLTEGSVAKVLADLTVPMVLGMLGMTVFNLADTYFIGQLGTKELAAMSFTFPVVMAVGSLSQGLGVGASAVISRAIGEGNQQKIKRLTTDSLILSVLLVAGFVGVGLFTINPLFRFLGATPEVLPLIRQYMVIWYPGMVAVVIPMVGNNAIRATGDTKTPSMVMLVAVITNIILDPLLIFGLGPFPRLELAGAALATVFARTITLAVALWILYYREQMITRAMPRLGEVLNSWKQILYIGLPTAATNITVPVSSGIVTKLIAAFGPTAVAAFGVAIRIESFSLLVIMALVSVLSPFVGQNWGAKKYDRAELSLKYSQQFSIGWGLAMAILLAIAGKSLASLFNDNSQVVSTVMTYFWIVPLSYGLYGVLKIGTTVLSVLNKPFQSSVLTLVQTFALYIPLAYLGAEIFGLVGIFAAAALSYIFSGIAAYFWLRKNLAESMDYDFLQRIVTIEQIQDQPVSLGYWISRIQTHARNYLTQKLSQHHLDSRTLAFLMALLREDGLSRGELSQKLQVNETLTARVLTILIDLGYVRWETERQGDGKEKVFITQQARQISPEVKSVLQTWSEIISQDFTEDEREMALKLLQKMNANALAWLS